MLPLVFCEMPAADANSFFERLIVLANRYPTSNATDYRTGTIVVDCPALVQRVLRGVWLRGYPLPDQERQFLLAGTS
jgi:hypothetical protein